MPGSVVSPKNIPSNKSINYTSHVTVSNTKSAISKLNSCIDIDNINTNHVKYATEEFYYFLTKFINLCFIHSYIPPVITKDIITPLVKDRWGDITSIKNYRPIIKSSIFLKIIEYIILEKNDKYW